MAVLLGIAFLHFIHLVFHYRKGFKGFSPLTLENTDSSPRQGFSIIIPARNEARNIAKTLDSLQKQTYRPFEIWVVDDHSDDETAQTVQKISQKDPRVQLLKAPPLPPDWLGKPHALGHGAKYAKHQLLLFTDADVEFHPQALSAAVSELNRRKADLLTLLPQSILGGFWECVIQPSVLSIILYGLNVSKINDPSDPQSFGIGAFLLIRRETFLRVGGYSPIKDQLIDDYAMANLVKKNRGTIWLSDGREYISIRMYESFSEIWKGWQKNFYAGLMLPFRLGYEKRQWVLWEKKPLLTLLLVTLFLSFTFVFPPVAFFWTLFSNPSTFTLLLSILTFFAFLFFGFSLYNRLEKSPFWTFTLPLGAVITLGIAITSTWQNRVRGGPTWRGRHYPHANQDPGATKNFN
ncbi:MAG TPA: glycosyltransferase [Nitrospiria bacterium]|jgi:chlorobactene glucosyltransferase